MKIEIVRRCRVKGKDCLPGEVVETDNGIALERINAGLAKRYVEPKTPPPGKEDGAEETSGGTKTDTEETEVVAETAAKPSPLAPEEDQERPSRPRGGKKTIPKEQ